MNHNIIKSVIFDQHETIEKTHVYKRDYYFDLNVNYVLVGLRRAGKTMTLYSIVQKLIEEGTDWEQIIYVNFEDERLSGFSLSDFNDIILVKNEITDKKAYYFFDEIQSVPGWEKFARRLADEKQFVYITGSNAKMLSSEISRTLGGRFITKYISTYGFEEYLKARGVELDENTIFRTSGKGLIIKNFDEFYHFGGFPEIVNITVKREYVSNVYQKIILGDVIARNNIRNDTALRLLVKKIAEVLTSDISYSKLYNSLKSIGISISKDTLIDYVGYLKDAYLLFDIKNWVAKFVERESNPKYYFNDNGLLNLFLINKETSLLENIVALYLHNKYRDSVYYLKSSETRIDIDFYLPEENMAIQVAYSIDGDARKREIDNLVKYGKTNKSARLVIVTYEEEETIKEGDITIEVIPAYKFIM